MHQDFYYNHPDWFMVQADGNPLIRRDRVTKTTGPELYHTCITGPFYHEFIPQLFAKVHANYSVDGFYGNGWSGSHEICYCGRCRARFKEATDLDLPRDKNWDDPVWRQSKQIKRLTALAICTSGPDATMGVAFDAVRDFAQTGCVAGE
jgi:hypothetical protein